MAKKMQLREKRAYDRRHRTKEMKLHVGDKVQVLRTKDASKKGGKMKLPWMPVNGFYVVQTADNQKNVAKLRDPSTDLILPRKYPFEVIRLLSKERKRKLKANNRPKKIAREV